LLALSTLRWVWQLSPPLPLSLWWPSVYLPLWSCVETRGLYHYANFDVVAN
jgi:hypothetical protein